MLDKTSSNKVSVTFSDGTKAEFQSSPCTPILDDALAAGLPIMSQCKSGSCGTCVASLVTGLAPPIVGLAGCLLDSELSEGRRLLCSSHADSDCEFSLDYPSSVGAAAPKLANVFVDGVEWVAEDVVRLTTELADEDWIDFFPGQYMRVGIPDTNIIRSYSVSSCPEKLPKLEFLIKVVPNGRFSDYLAREVKTDDVLSLEGPFGSFQLREDHKRAKHILVAGGTGLAPIISMLDSIRTQPGTRPPILLSFGCRSEKSLFCEDILELREAWMSNLETRISLTRPSEEWVGRIGNPLSAISAEDISEDSVAYVCGSSRLVTFAVEDLVAKGLDETRIFSEKFLAE